jgi:serine/threonine protein kinase
VKQVCLLCERTSPDSNLYCQETYCPAEMSPNVLDYGEMLGDIEITRAVIVMRSAVLYEAVHQNEKVYLKVAHPGPEHKERLKREAEFLAARGKHKYLPVLRPPYVNTTVKADPYGKAMLKGHLLYFYLFEYVDGEPLRDVLMKNPQLWINHVGWIMISTAEAVSFLHSSGFYHLGVSPDCILVHFDEEPNAPRVLLYDLGVASDPPGLGRNWSADFVLPAYQAPELMGANGERPSAATDVYGLGLTLYELLVGEPTYTYKLRSDAEVYNAVRRNRRVQMNRVEDVKAVAGIALQAVHPQAAQRQNDATIFMQQLLAQFGKVPPPKRSRWPSMNTIMIVIIALLFIAFLITFAVSINEIATAPVG